MDLQIRNRVALVTGASSGLGEAIALSLAREGASVALAARRIDRLDAVANKARSEGAIAAEVFHFDQTDPLSPAALVAGVVQKFGKIDILVANGGGPKPGTFLETPMKDWDHAYAGTLRSMLLLVNSVLPTMRRQRWGRVIGLTSMSVKEPIPSLVLSNAMRVALVAALKTLAGEVANNGVTVNCIATGRILTERLRSLYNNDDAAILAAAEREIPLRRPGTVEEFAPLVTFLSGEHARYITGQTIAIDGGFIKGLL